MNLPRCGNDEAIDAEETSLQQVNENEGGLDASQIELNEIQLKLAQMSIYFYDSVKIASQRYVLSIGLTRSETSIIKC